MNKSKTFTVISKADRVYLKLENYGGANEKWHCTPDLQKASLFPKDGAACFAKICNEDAGMAGIQDWAIQEATRLVVLVGGAGKHAEYRAGYGQARADALSTVKEARKFIRSQPGHYKPNEDQSKTLDFKFQALGWVLSLIKVMQTSR